MKRLAKSSHTWLERIDDDGLVIFEECPKCGSYRLRKIGYLRWLYRYVTREEISDPKTNWHKGTSKRPPCVVTT